LGEFNTLKLKMTDQFELGLDFRQSCAPKDRVESNLHMRGKSAYYGRTSAIAVFAVGELSQFATIFQNRRFKDAWSR
jgi:hypothetical protein